MPWCEQCSKFWSPNSLTVEGDCPACGRTVAAPRPTDASGMPIAAEEYRAPWHFKLMIVLAAVYLGWRLVQLVQWLL